MPLPQSPGTGMIDFTDPNMLAKLQAMSNDPQALMALAQSPVDPMQILAQFDKENGGGGGGPPDYYSGNPPFASQGGPAEPPPLNPYYAQGAGDATGTPSIGAMLTSGATMARNAGQRPPQTPAPAMPPRSGTGPKAPPVNYYAGVQQSNPVGRLLLGR
jgi:hypothetical protein